MSTLQVPSGVEISLAALFRQVAGLTAEDLRFIFLSTSRRAKKFRKPIGELLGKAFAGLYNRRRQKVTGSRIDFWKLKSGGFKAKFIETAVNARIHGVNLEIILLCAEDLTQRKKMGKFPSPHLVCGSYVFGEVLNGWKPSGMEPTPPDEAEDLGVSDHGAGTWIWQPGYHWNDKAGQFTK